MTDETITMKLKLDLDDLAAQFRAAADALTADRHAANEERQRERQREEELEDAWQSRDWETVRRLQDEAEQQEAVEPDPLDENDHRDRVLADGRRISRTVRGCWHEADEFCTAARGPSLADWAERFGPLTFAPDATPDAPRAVLTASEAESGAEEGDDAPDPLDELLCPECGHGIDCHRWDGVYALTCCLECDDPDDCRKAPSDIARHLIARATS